ncbi:MAG: hypothetical protein Q8Q02_02205 [Nocardioides sp.]|nr:hypothetical protein [Nocardioides sp.]
MSVLPTPPRRALAWLLGLALVAGLALLGWTWRHPTAFPEAGGWGSTHDRARPGVPLYVGMTYPEDDAHGSMTVEKVRANVVSDSADATIDFYVCTVDGSEGIGAIGSAMGDDIDDYCLSLVPAEGVEVDLDAVPMEQVVMEVAIGRPGVVRIEGMDLTYRLGWQTGTQRTGGFVELAGKRR